jgi:hypothetical protein
MIHGNLKTGDRVRFYSEEDDCIYTVQCRSENFIICTAPCPEQQSVWYSIIDLERGVRGTDNMVFGNGYETPEQCASRLEELVAGDMEVSYRNNVPLPSLDFMVAPESE